MDRNFGHLLAFSALTLFSLPLSALDVVVSTNADAGPNSLRQAILEINANPDKNNKITFDEQSFVGPILLTGALPPLNPGIGNELIIEGPPPRVSIDGDHAYRAFFAQSGNVCLSNLVIQNTKAKGADGETGPRGGGGALGAGAGLFVNVD